MTSKNNHRAIFLRRLPVLIPVIAVALLLFSLLGSTSSCGIYKFRDISIPDSVKVVKIEYIENKASYINPNLSPRLTDRLRQKIVSQTRLKQTTGDDADWIISPVITGYSFSTSGISNQQVATNRLSVSVKVTVNKVKGDKIETYDVSRNFDFSATQSIQQAESALIDEMVRGLADDIFNRVFSEW